MNDSAPSPLYLGESPVAVPLPRAVERAYLWAIGGLGGLATALLLMLAVAYQSSAEAERIAASTGGSYLGTLVSALAAGHGRKPL
ncbi:hypothetical protein [Methylobacterium sp. sgz302541]|uniref:hypothetical protein n=1 Tax=unclassified Methylobacterium TaxID=2615210 RepID=UPI003D3497FB